MLTPILQKKTSCSGGCVEADAEVKIISKVMRCAFFAGLFCVAAGCSTRQTADVLEGSTSQRLVTYSLEKFVTELVKQPQVTVAADSRVLLNVLFLHDHPMVAYARQLIARQMEVSNGITVVSSHREDTDFEIDVFFNSIGTDRDSYGLSLPTLGLAPSPDGKINILAIDMFHGLAEGYAVIKQVDTGAVARTNRLLARVRADNVATPVLDFPINQLE